MEVRESTVERSVFVCSDCGGTMFDYGDWVECENFDGEAVVGVNGCGFDAEREACKHDIEYPRQACGICRGTWDGVVRSGVTGRVISSPDFISWFVPSALGHDGSANRGWANFVGVEQSSGALSERAAGIEVDHAPEGLGVLDGVRRFDLGEVGAPEWYRGGSAVGASSVADACDDNGLDWYGMSEAYAADLLVSLLPSGVIEPVAEFSGLTAREASSMYSGAGLAVLWDGGERLREWRAATGRTNGASAGAGRGWAS